MIRAALGHPSPGPPGNDRASRRRTEWADPDRRDPGDGSVTSDPAGINCPDDCQEGFATGTTVTLTAHPADSTLNVIWSGACDHATGPTCTLTHEEDTARVEFQLAPPLPPPPPPSPVPPLRRPRRHRHRRGPLTESIENQRLPWANVAFHVPETMTLRQASEVRLVMSAQRSIKQLKKKGHRARERRRSAHQVLAPHGGSPDRNRLRDRGGDARNPGGGRPEDHRMALVAQPAEGTGRAAARRLLSGSATGPESPDVGFGEARHQDCFLRSSAVRPPRRGSR